MVFRALRAVFAHRRVMGIAFVAAAVCLALALVSHSGEDPAWLLNAGARTEATNWLGPVGAFVSEATLQVLGVVAFLLPVFLFQAGRRRLFASVTESDDPAVVRTIILASLVVTAAGLFAIVQPAFSNPDGGFGWGGAIGALLAGALAQALNPLGAGLVLAALCLIAWASLREWGFADRGAKEHHQTLPSRVWARLRSLFRRSAESRANASPDRRRFVARIARRKASKPNGKVDEDDLDLEPEASWGDDWGAELPSPKPTSRPGLLMSHPRANKSKKTKKAPIEPPQNWELPSLQLLTRRAHQPAPAKKALEERRRALEATCLEYGVRGQVERIQPGPVVTTFEFRLGEGEKLKKLQSRHEEICMALHAPAIRVERVRGKGVVGIEIPNESPSIVGLREVLESPEFQQDGGALPIALGRLVDGTPLVKNLSEMPHLLIAGATGAGKSVQINTLLCSLLIRQTPDDLRLILIDPKRVELRPYRNIPHLLTPLILEPDKAKTVLQHACRELDRRTRVLEECGVRNIDGYNRHVDRLAAKRDAKRRKKDDEEPLPARMPRLVIVIDELADLFIHARAEVTPAIQRLLSLGRAEGIHLVLATQRPSTDIVSGTLKANLPTRIAFRVASYVDSRTILDRMGAESLLGKGDMLVMRPGADLPRAQGALVDEKEVGKLAKFWESAASPVFDERMLEDEATAVAAGRDGADVLASLSGSKAGKGTDALLPQARELIVREQKASTSMLQTEMGLGYQRARRIVAELEKQGVVGPARGAQPREVLIQP